MLTSSHLHILTLDPSLRFWGVQARDVSDSIIYIAVTESSDIHTTPEIAPSCPYISCGV